jgi:hypothetical protein
MVKTHHFLSCPKKKLNLEEVLILRPCTFYMFPKLSVKYPITRLC